MVLIIFISLWLIIVALIVIITISTLKKRKIKQDADKFVEEFKTRINVTEGIEEELKKRKKAV